MQLGLEGMPARLFTCTPSRLLTWQDCPRRYFFAYVERPSPPRGPAWAHNTLGAAVHLALARLWDLPRSARTGPEAARLLVGAWQSDGFRDEAQSLRYRAWAADLVARYVDEAVLREPVGIERTVAFRTARLAVSGRVDRVDERDGELVVVDYKTGRSPVTDDDARGSLALALYVLGVRRTFRRPCTRVELHHLPSSTVVAWEHTEASLARHVGRAEALAQEVSAAVGVSGAEAVAASEERFPARPSTLCAWCSQVRRCAEGLAAAGAPKRTWDGLPVLDSSASDTDFLT